METLCFGARFVQTACPPCPYPPPLAKLQVGKASNELSFAPQRHSAVTNAYSGPAPCARLLCDSGRGCPLRDPLKTAPQRKARTPSVVQLFTNLNSHFPISIRLAHFSFTFIFSRSTTNTSRADLSIRCSTPRLDSRCEEARSLVNQAHVQLAATIRVGEPGVRFCL